MTRLVIDSSAWIEFFRPGASQSAELVASAIQNTDVVLPDLVYLEVMYGFSTPAIAKRAEKILSLAESVTLSEAGLAHTAIQHHWALRAKSITIRSVVDLLIGAWCIKNDAYLLHFDRDYDKMEKHLGLKVWRGTGPSPNMV